MPGINLQVTTDSWGVGDLKWMLTRKGFDTGRPCTIDFSLFNALHYVNGFIPSGTALGIVTATGRVGPYSTLLSNGLDVAVGLLLHDVRAKDASGNVFTSGFALDTYIWEGVVSLSRLPTFTGAAAALGVLDAPGQADLKFMKFEA